MAEDRPTVTRVAQAAGVSSATVSRVLNGLPASDDVRERVQRAAAELGYRPNPLARSLKVRRSQQLALAVADVGNPVYVDMMRAIEDVTRSSGYRLLVSSTGGRSSDTLELLESLEHGYADGLVLSPVRVDDTLVADLHGSPTPSSSSAPCPAGSPSTTSGPTPRAASAWRWNTSTSRAADASPSSTVRATPSPARRGGQASSARSPPRPRRRRGAARRSR